MVSLTKSYGSTGTQQLSNEQRNWERRFTSRVWLQVPVNTVKNGHFRPENWR